jgi:hypothetical protein
MSSQGAGVAVAVRSTYEEAHGPTTTHILAGAQPSSSKNSQEERPHYPWLDGYLQWLEGKEAREEYYGRLERRSGR